LTAVGKKWKDFKANLKKKFFKGKITEEQIRKQQGDRLNDDDWKFLKNHWTTPESEVSKLLLVTALFKKKQHLVAAC